ncbi:hypothetical protein ACGFK1_29040 [Mycobacterium sp. NPDC048908]|uniref:hypothetical protein n=1 Tax=Mycobacterium sp. NPDC048908 TaxID=3364292 RepID=UPI003710E374
MGTDVDLLKHPVVSAAVGAAAMAVGAAEAAYRVAEKVPVFGPLMRRGVGGLSERGDQWVTQTADQFKALVAAVAVSLVDLVLDEMDLNAVVRERVDIDVLAADLDVDAVINRIDLIALADKVIEGVDLSAIIRESTNSMTAEVMTDVRTQGAPTTPWRESSIACWGVTGTTGDLIGTRRWSGGRDHHPGIGGGH